MSNGMSMSIDDPDSYIPFSTDFIGRFSRVFRWLATPWY